MGYILIRSKLLKLCDVRCVKHDCRVPPAAPGDHSAARIKEIFKQSLSALGSHKIRVLYLHFPDRSVPYAETAKAIDELYKEGHLYVFELDACSKLDTFPQPGVRLEQFLFFRGG